MTARKKKGLFTMIGGAIAIAIGGILVATTATPDWVATVLLVIGLVGDVLGFTFVFPDHD